MVSEQERWLSKQKILLGFTGRTDVHGHYVYTQVSCLFQGNHLAVSGRLAGRQPSLHEWLEGTHYFWQHQVNSNKQN